MGELVSVIIPTFNRPEFLANAISSVLEQSYGNFEIIVVNDCSTVSYEGVQKEFLDTRIHWLNQVTNAGVSAARNRGIDFAKGKFICFLDDDDRFLPDKLLLQIERFKEDPSLDVVVGDAIFKKEDINSVRKNRHVGNQHKEFLRRYSLWGICVPLIKKEVFEKGVRFDLSFRLNEDYDFFVQIAKNSRFGYVDRPLVVIYDSKDQFSYDFKERFFGTSQLFLKYWKVSLSYGFMFFLDQFIKTFVLCSVFLVSYLFGKKVYLVFTQLENFIRFKVFSVNR